MDLKECIYIVVSILSIFLYVISVQYNKKEKILFIQFFASLCYLIVYLIKGAFSGAAIEIIEELKDVVFIKYEKKEKQIPIVVLILFLLLLVVVSIIFYDGILSLLPLFINLLLFTSTYFKNPNIIRWIMLVAGILWGIFNIYVKAYIIVIGNVLEVISAIISIIRFKKIKN